MPFLTRSFASEYLDDVTKAIHEFVNAGHNGSGGECQQVHSIDSQIDHNDPEFKYYRMTVSYFAEDHREPEGGFLGTVVPSDYDFFGAKIDNLKRELIETIEQKLQTKTKLRTRYFPNKSEHNRLEFEYFLYDGGPRAVASTPYVGIQTAWVAPGILGYRVVRRYHQEPQGDLSPLSKTVAEQAPDQWPKEQFLPLREVAVETLRRIIQLLDGQRYTSYTKIIVEPTPAPTEPQVG